MPARETENVMTENPDMKSDTLSSDLPTPDLEAMSLDELTQLIEDAQAVVQRRRKEARGEILRRWQEEARRYGLTMEDILPSHEGPPARKTRVDKGSPLPVRYRGPSGETWTGRGRVPLWLRELETSGRSRAEFEVGQGTLP